MATSAVPVKQEPTTSVPLAERILTILQSNEGSGISDAQLSSLLPDVDSKERVFAVNGLLKDGKLQLLQSGKSIVYKIKKHDDSVPGGDNQEKLIYQIIQESGNKGIWIRDIRFKSSLLLTQVNKVLKSLEGKKLIKSVKCVNASKKKVYMLYELEPDRSVTGGAWYSDQDFESEFVDILNQQCNQYLLNKRGEAEQKTTDPVSCRNSSYASSEEISRHIDALGISKANISSSFEDTAAINQIKLSVEDVEMVLDTLIYDGKAEFTVHGIDQKKLYRSIKQPIISSTLSRVPCGICPVSDECHIGGVVSPVNCVYMNDWLKF